jgi:hypothetical protein
MSITNANDFPIIAASTSGNALADVLNRFYDAVQTNQSGAGRPPDIKTGGLWTKTEAGSLVLMMFNGVNDIVIGTVTGDSSVIGDYVFPLAQPFSDLATYTLGDVIFDPVGKKYYSAKTDLPAKVFQIGDWQELPNIFNDMLRANTYRRKEVYTKDEVEARIAAVVAASVANYLPLAGGTITGTLRVNGDITSGGNVNAYS